MALEVGMNIKQLLSESNIDSWDNALCNTLDVYGLLNYFDEDVQPPTPQDPDTPTAAEKKAAESWRVERARVLLAITNSMKSRNESIGMVIKEYTSFNRASFDSMASFFNRHFFLRKLNDLTNGHFTMSDLLDKFNTIATTEATTPALSVQVKVGTKEKEDTKSSNNKKDKKKGRRETIDCTYPSCKRQIPTGFVYAACSYYKNPDNDKVIKALQKIFIGTTALVVYNLSNLNNLATIRFNLLVANSIPEFSMLSAIFNPAGFH
ncbi:hypothetical protein QBC32DRAFT_374816 [Pseudoneurospora amorphoporcata]|uniref:Uncharacterized protein n=1 Tax=Pseudoneurospora amorphoporcata TaxID=241081 RepID=A0AAN6SAK6_9PEZI|nr:hypothetical protein QBC32DRAFT_374816 [Pseudoneurospora amorphoporcata]